MGIITTEDVTPEKNRVLYCKCCHDITNVYSIVMHFSEMPEEYRFSEENLQKCYYCEEPLFEAEETWDDIPVPEYVHLTDERAGKKSAYIRKKYGLKNNPEYNPAKELFRIVKEREYCDYAIDGYLYQTTAQKNESLIRRYKGFIEALEIALENHMPDEIRRDMKKEREFLQKRIEECRTAASEPAPAPVQTQPTRLYGASSSASDSISCPRCGNSNLDLISAQKAGFGLGKAAAGVVITGGLGAAAGLVGSNKIRLHCLKCGKSWKPGR